jgi:hypothetical protein
VATGTTVTGERPAIALEEAVDEIGVAEQASGPLGDQSSS